MDNKPVEKEKNMSSKQTKKALVADDTKSNLKVISGMLADLGIETRCVSNGLDAVTSAVKDQYDIIFMDINMPGLDGIEAAKRIRLNEKKKNLARVPIVAYSTEEIVKDPDFQTRSQMDDILEKPVDLQNLVLVLEKHIGDVKIENTPSAERITGHDEMEGPYDIPGAAAELGISAEVLLPILKEFIEEAPGMVKELHAHCHGGDAQRAYQSAHKLKGAAGNLRLNLLSRLALGLENSCKSSIPGDYQKTINRMNEEIEILKRIIFN